MIPIQGMYGFLHIAFMTTTVIFIWLISSKMKSFPQHIGTFLKVTALLSMTFDPMYWIWELRHTANISFATTLPLYLCSLFWILMPIIAFTKKDTIVNRIATSCVCTIGIITGILGIVFNVYLNQFSFFSFVPLRSLLYHVLMITVPSVMWRTGYYKPKSLDLGLFYIPVLILLIPCYYVNKFFGYDYCYFNGGIGTPLELFSSGMPIIVFLAIIYTSLYILCVLCFFCPMLLRVFKNHKNKLEIIRYNI